MIVLEPLFYGDVPQLSGRCVSQTVKWAKGMYVLIAAHYHLNTMPGWTNAERMAACCCLYVRCARN